MELITKPTHLNCLILRKYLSEKFLVRIVLLLRWKVPPLSKWQLNEIGQADPLPQGQSQMESNIMEEEMV